ncbi:MAG: biopolymer transporter ExbD, partial [Deltaproteobacteria bacterium]
MRFQTRNRDDVQLDVTPLVDVVFLLLIFFMLSTTLSINPGIKVDLP